MSRIDSRTSGSVDKFEEEKVEHIPRLTAIDEDSIDLKHGPSGYVAANDEERALDKAINRKLDLIVLPLCAINFLLCGIDKGAIGNVATTSFATDVGLSRDDISDSVSLLSVTFVTLQPFGVALGRRVGVSRWIPLIMILWGTITACHAAIKSTGQLFALRLLLGAFEASFFPSTVYFLSTFYPRYSLGFRLGIFAGFYSIASAFSGIIAYGVFHIKSTVLHTWQILFILLGCLTIAFAFVTFFIFPRSNEKTWFLNARQQEHLLHRMRMDIAAHTADAEASGSKTTWRDVRDALDWRKLLIITGNIMARLELIRASVLQMSVPPFVVGACLLWCFLYSSDRFRERSLHTCAAMVLAIVGLAILVGIQDNNKLRYGFLHVCLGGAFVAGPCILGWLAGNTPVTGVRALVIGINGYSNLAGVIAGQLFKPKYAPSYSYPCKVTMILMVVGIVLFLSMRVVYMWTNKKRRAQIAKMSAEEIEAERLNDKRRGDQKITFIYGL
ncbi:hypothetical protein Rhopal_003112-T1 [Rhodotorula paludigena]|uniref:Major facilitator superfamily (MFS) profile domain-containing protein n=1 Tax=Rhodotorula paludigena TaxID=86838 RepID=A0AAV5GN50_9BASI|nr:hypothetical protein Rhopal_003112-T1 [Rhodotorula paludigena]